MSAAAKHMLPRRGLVTVAEEKPPRLRGRELRVLLPYLQPYAKRAWWALTLLMANTGFRLAAPVLFQRAVDLGIVAKDGAALDRYGWMFIAAAVGTFLTLRYSALSMGIVGQNTMRDLRVSSFKHLTGLSLGFFERERSGRLVARVTSDPEAVERLVTEELIRMLAEVTFMVGAAVVLFIMDVKLALAALSVLPLIAIATYFFRRRAQHVYSELRERVATVLSYLQETLRGVHVVQAFTRERTSRREFGEVNDAWGDAKAGTYRLDAQYFSTVETLAVLGTALLLAYGGIRTFNGDLSFGKLAAFLVYLTLFFEPLHHLTERYTTFQSAMAGLARIAQLLEVHPQIVDKPGARPLQRVQGLIELDHVHFRYSPAAPDVLHDVSLRVNPGETLALVGPTGAGKSTIVKLLARFYDTSEGQVRIDGHDITDITTKSLRDAVGLVPQEAFLFSGDIMQNIKFGRPDATDEQVEATCKTLGIDDFIRSLPDGYSTQVRERGARLAAGERQLIALARALVADPSIVLLDEATSSLDSATESRIDKAFHAALQGRTCVVIAHRLSTVMKAGTIAVVENGRIVESGSHAALLAKGGRYAGLYRSWLTPREQEV